MNLTNKTIVITGGGSGLGAGTAARMIAAGARALLLDMNQAAGEEMAARLGENALFVQADVVDPEQVQAGIDQALARFGAIHGLVNCAGVATPARMLNRDGTPHDLGHFAKVVAINLTGSFNCIRLAAAVMSQNQPEETGERGVVVNTASIAAFDGQIGQAAYAASKGGIVSMTLPLAREFARVGIRVMTIAPGIMETPMLAQLPQAALDSLAAQVPFPARLGQPEEFADLVHHIFTNPYLNGEVIRMDGAIRMGPR